MVNTGSFLEAQGTQDTRLDIPLFSQWPVCPAKLTVTVWSQTLVSLSRSSSSLEGFTRGDYSDPVWDTRSFHAAFLPRVGEVQITEQSTHCLCCCSCLCVSSELPWHQHKSQLQAPGLTHRQGESCLSLPHSFLPILRGCIFLWSAPTHFCARKFPLALRSILQFSFTLGVLADKYCVCMLCYIC